MTGKPVPVVPSMLGMLHDVDMSAGPPNTGDTLIAGSDKIFRPGSPGGGFNPAENPVIIGLGSTGGGGSSPTNLAGAYTDAVVVGHNAAVTGVHGIAIGGGTNAASFYLHTHAADNAVSIGYETQASNTYATALGSAALASGDSSTAVGVGAQATGSNDTSVGSGADATGGYGVAVGQGSVCSGNSATALGTVTQATAVNATAVGSGAHATHTNATAIGVNAATSATNQVMLGSTSDTVVVAYKLNVYNLPTSSAGLSTGDVWNNSGVLNVA